MKRLLVLFFVLFVSVWLGATVASDPGYVLVAYRQWTMELPLWFAIILLLLLFGVLYWIVRLWHSLRAVPKQFHMWSLQRQSHNAQRLTKQGLLLLAMGKNTIAEKKLLQGVKNSAMPWLNYLAAAYAANLQNNITNQNNYLHKANEIAPEAQIAIDLAQAHFYLEQQRWEQALVVLKQLHSLAIKQTLIQRLLAQVYLQLKDWNNLINLLPDLRRQKVFSAEKITNLEVQAYQGLLLETAQMNSQLKLQQAWQGVPKALREQSILVGCYVQLLLANHVDDEAEKVLSKTLSSAWSNDLVRLYGFVESAKPDRQLATAESWLKSHPRDAMLLLTAGRLCMRNQLWGKAKSYFEASVAYNPQPEAYQELGKLLQQLGEQVAAKDCYLKGLELALHFSSPAF